MKKIIIILLAIIGGSPSVKALVCVEGDCDKMGYTINVDDTVPYCEAYIRCPYNINLKTCARYNAYPLSECPEGGECSQSPKYRLASAEESIKFKVKAQGTSGYPVNRFVIISMDTNGDYSIDWGDEGRGDDCSDIAYKTNEICHGYSELGKEYTITISGNVTSFKLIYDPTETLYEDADGTTYHYADLKSIENLNLPSLKTLDGAFAGLLGNDDFGNPIYSGISTLSGTIPTMAGLTNLTSASNMFAGNTGELQLADNFTLPSNLKNASDMFNGCVNLTGTIKKLPDSLTQVSDMFSNTALSASCLYKPEGVTAAQGSIAQNSPNINLYSDWKNYADECDYTVAGNNTLCHCLPSTGCMEGFKAAYKTDDLKTYCSGERGGGYWAWHPYNMPTASSCAYGTAIPDWGYTCPDGSDPTTEADVFGECGYCGDLNSITPMEPKDEYYCFKCQKTGWGSADDGATEKNLR